MYTKHFNLTAEPFALTPDPAFLYLSPGHAEALAALQIGLTGRRGLMVMTGEVGTGKTTLLYSLLTQLGPNVHSAYIANTQLPFDDMLRQALADFGLPPRGHGRADLLTELNDFLRRCATEGTIAALVVDEAQNLDDDAFENLRLLSNFETFTAKLLQIVLVGQPELEARLRQPHLRQVAERVAVHCHINPLARRERRNYVAHRLQCAGGSLDLFTRAALRLALRKSRGIPRRINILCHNALLFAYGRRAGQVSRARVRAAIRGDSRFALSPFANFSKGGLRGIYAAGTACAVLALLGASILSTQATAVARFFHVLVAAQHAAPSLEPVLASVSQGSPQTAPSNVAEPSVAAADEPAVTSPQASAPAPEAPAPQRKQSGDHAELRTVRVAAGATLSSLARGVYGKVNAELLHRVALANPQIVDLNLIRSGDTLRFPERGALARVTRAEP
jgi:general secretion pathway protein A